MNKSKYSLNKRSLVHIIIIVFPVGLIYGFLASRSNELGLFLRRNFIVITIIVTIFSGLYSVFFTLIKRKRKGDNLE